MKIRSLLLITLFSLCVFSEYLYAGVVMTGTRIIYPSQLKEKAIQLTNPDNQPYIVQLQLSDSESQDDNNQNMTPFIVTPPIFRMEAKTGQSIRLIYSGSDLPKDRESLFYLSFTQLPSIKSSVDNSNQLIFTITNKVKIFYRPESIIGSQNEVGKNIKLSLIDDYIEASNPSGYYAVIRQAEMIINGKIVPLANSTMLPPKSKVKWQLSSPIESLVGARLKLTLVNDYGVDVVSERPL